MGLNDWRLSMANWIAPKAAQNNLNSGLVDSPYGMLDAMVMRHPPRRGTWELMESYKQSPWLRAVTTKIAEHIAATPWYLTRATQKGKPVRHLGIRSAATHKYRASAARRFKSSGGKLDEITDHPLLELISNNPNPYMSGLSLRRLNSIYMDFIGEKFELIEYRRNGQPGELWPVPAHWVMTVPTSTAPYFELGFYGKHIIVEPQDVIWTKYPDTFNPYGRGVGAGYSLGDEIETDEYAAKVAKTQLFNNAIPATLVAIEGASKEALTKAKVEWDQKFRGPLKASQVHFHPGKMSVQQLQAKFADMQLMDLRKFEREAFTSVYGVPPEIMGLLQHSNKATVQEAMTIFAREVLVPRLEFERAEMQRQLAPMFDDTLLLDYENPVPEDDEFRLEVMKGNPGAFTVGDWHKLAGSEDEGPDDDVYLVPTLVKPIRSLGDEADKPPPPPPVPFGAKPPGEKPDDEPQDGGGKKPPKEPEKDAPRYAGPPPRATKAAKQVHDAVDALTPAYLKNEVLPVFKDRIKEWGDDTLEDLGMQPSFNLLNPAVTAHLDALAGDSIDDIDDTTKQALRDTLTDGVEAGEDIDKLSARVESVFADADGYRAENIARTEVGRSSNFATLESFRQSGVIDQKQWLATQDDRTRDTHAELDGQVRDIDEDFEVDGMTADHPGDFGIADQDCGCRCAVTAAVDDPTKATKSADRLGMWKAVDNKREPWDKAAKSAFQRGFAKQKAAVLAALRKG